MEQDRIWDYFQNEGIVHEAFSEARSRFFARRLRAGEAVLNIGVGSGLLERLALARQVDIHALDPSNRAVEKLQRELTLGGKARVGYAQSIPFADGMFDGVVMSEVLEHLDDQGVADALSEVRRVLKPCGTLWASTPYREDLGVNTVVCPDCGKVFHRFGHVQSFDRTRMNRILTEFGFDVRRLRITTFIDWKRRGLRRLAKSTMRWLLAHLGEGLADPHIVVKAVRP